MRPLLITAAFAAAVVVASCTPPAQRCQTADQCGATDVCLQVGTCATKCSDDAQCGGGSRCSASGGCVSSSGCGDDRDCSTGTLCSTGTCQLPCTAQRGCFEGLTCMADGHCVEPMNPGDGGPNSCGGELFQATKTQANFLIVIDHSGSMMDKVGGTAKWTSAVSALKTITAQYDDQIRFGLQMFSTSSKRCDPGQTNVEIGDNTAAQIAAALPNNANGDQTPIGGALQVASMNQALADANRANFVLLVTDGIENCNGKPADQVKALAARGIKTYVVGFGNEVNAQNLSEMAIAGGTARNAMPRYFQADSPQELTQAFGTIAQGAVGCDFKLTKTPPDASKIFVSVNGQLIPRDPNRVAGWEYTPGTDRVTLYGPACDVVVNQPGSQVSLVYGCADPSLVGDGGYAFPTDAGDLIN